MKTLLLTLSMAFLFAVGASAQIQPQNKPDNRFCCCNFGSMYICGVQCQCAVPNKSGGEKMAEDSDTRLKPVSYVFEQAEKRVLAEQLKRIVNWSRNDKH
jgi:hypothetical protein